MEDTNIDPEHHLVFCHTPLAGVIDFQKGDVHSEFIQDPIISMETELGTIVLLDPMKQVNPENSNIAEQLAAYTGYLVQPCSIELEGGNILVGDDYALVGMNILYQNLELGKKMDANEPEKWVANHLKSLLGLRYLLWIGAENSFDFEDFHSTGNHQLQPFFHIDLFLTLAGKASGSKELVFLGRIDKKFVFDLAPGEGELIDKLNVLLDAVESHLESSGEAFPGPRFEVARLDMGGRIVAEEGIRRFVPYSYNNSQVEWYRGFARIYLPSYKGLEILEQRVTEQLSRLDFKYIKFIHGPFAEYAENGGSLHCITNILQRGQF
jgi:hypothetical protein